MKHFFQQNSNHGALKASFAFLLLMFVMQQGFGQCVQCDGTTTSGLFPSAIGRYTKATGNYSFAGGIYSEANGSASIAFGNRTYANGANSVVLGMFLKSNSSPTIVLGAGFDENNRLENTLPYSMMIGFGSTKPTFFVGPSSGVNNTGKIGIGNVTDPQAKLHIRADALEEASLRLEPSGSAYNAVVYFTNSGHAVKAKTGGHLTFSTQSTKGFVFEAGNVGIGSTNPEAKLQISGGDVYIEDINQGIIMKSPNGQCWRGTLTDQGMLSFVPTSCPEATLTVLTSTAETAPLKLFPNLTGDKVILDFQRSEHHTTLQISTLEGKIMHEQTLLSDKTELSLAQFPAGTYIFVVLQNGQKIASGKVVRE